MLSLLMTNVEPRGGPQSKIDFNKTKSTPRCWCCRGLQGNSFPWSRAPACNSPSWISGRAFPKCTVLKRNWNLKPWNFHRFSISRQLIERLIGSIYRPITMIFLNYVALTSAVRWLRWFTSSKQPRHARVINKLQSMPTSGDEWTAVLDELPSHKLIIKG